MNQIHVQTLHPTKAHRVVTAAGGCPSWISVRGGLDEDQVAQLLSSGAPIDGFGIGTSMAVSNDAPDLDIVYVTVHGFKGFPL